MSAKRAAKARENGKKGGRPKGSKDGPDSTRVLKLAALRERVLRDAEMSADATLEQIRRLGFYDARRLFNPETGALKPLTELTESEAACIAGIDVLRRGPLRDVVVKIKLADRGKYLEMAARSHGLLRDKVDVDIATKPDLTKLSDAELATLAKMMRKAAPSSQGNP